MVQFVQLLPCWVKYNPTVFDTRKTIIQSVKSNSIFKVNAAEVERLAAFEEHTQRLKTFQECERTMNRLQKSLKRNILNSKPYFELKAERMKNVEERK